MMSSGNKNSAETTASKKKKLQTVPKPDNNQHGQQTQTQPQVQGGGGIGTGGGAAAGGGTVSSNTEEGGLLGRQKKGSISSRTSTRSSRKSWSGGSKTSQNIRGHSFGSYSGVRHSGKQEWKKLKNVLIAGKKIVPSSSSPTTTNPSTITNLPGTKTGAGGGKSKGKNNKGEEKGKDANSADGKEEDLSKLGKLKARVNRKHDPVRELLGEEALENVAIEKPILKKKKGKKPSKKFKGVKKKPFKVSPGVPHDKVNKIPKKFPTKDNKRPIPSYDNHASVDDLISLRTFESGPTSRVERDDDEKGSDIVLERQEVKCGKKNSTDNLEFIMSLLRTKEKYQIPEYGDGMSCPKGLEFLTFIENITVELRHVDSRDGICLNTFTQYDIMENDENYGTNILVALGIESATFCSIWCFLSARHFRIKFYDYNANLIMSMKRYSSIGTFCTTYFCCCCCCGSQGCGNGVEVLDGEGNFIGRVEQCKMCATRLVLLSETEVTEIKTPYHNCSDFCSDRAVRHGIPIKKFNVYNAKDPNPIVRIEQYVEKSNICKFILLETLEQVGFVRKLGDNKMQIDLWRDFDEAEKAVLIAGCFLVDHLILNVSTEGSYVTEKDLESGRRKVRGCCYRFIFFLRCRLFIYIFLFFLLFGVIICTILVVLSR